MEPNLVIRVEHHIYDHGSSESGGLLETMTQLSSKIDQLLQGGMIMSAELDTLTQRVHDEETVIDSAVALLTDLSAQFAAVKDDPAKIQALADEVQAKSNTLAAAVTANTPAAATTTTAPPAAPSDGGEGAGTGPAAGSSGLPPAP